jgi:hypothetical protein
MSAGMRKTATRAGLRAVGSAPATGAVFRALAENPERTEIIPTSGKVSRATAGCGGAAGNARGGRAPQLTPAIRAIRTPHSEMENYQTNPIFLEQIKYGFYYE